MNRYAVVAVTLMTALPFVDARSEIPESEGHEVL